MDCDNQEIEATKTIGSTDIDKVLKKLKNKNTKESIILLDYIEKLEKDDREWYDIADDILRATSKYGEISIGEIPDYIEKLEKENKNLKDINQKLLNKCQERLSYSNEEIITELYTRLS